MLVPRPLGLLLRWRRPHTHPEPRVVLGQLAVVKRSAGLDCAVSPLGCAVLGLRVAVLLGRRERIVHPGAFSGAADFSVFELEAQEGSTQPALAKPRPLSVAKSSLRVGDAIVWREHAARSRVPVVEPLARDMRVTQVFDSRHLLPGHPWSRVCSSDASAEFCQTTVKAAHGAVVHRVGFFSEKQT